MPLPGGPSDKLGNRYELWIVVRRMLDLVTGKLEWLRLEIPGEDAVEFRCGGEERLEAHQVKRGISGGGHWTISALRDVISGFGKLLDAESDLSCVFTSEHAAAELKELSERARDAKDVVEFTSKFLEPQWLKTAWSQVRAIWGTDDNTTHAHLRRIWAGASTEADVKGNTDAILQLLVSGNPATARSVLVELALESVHRELRAADVARRLTERGLPLLAIGGARSITRTLQPPQAVGVRRDKELDQLRELVGGGRSTIFIAGISGIGKTVIASQYTGEAGLPVCWVDCELISSPIEALSAIGEFLVKHANDDVLSRALSAGSAQPKALARLAGQRLAVHGCVLVWDGVTENSDDGLRVVIDSVASTITGGLQLVTTQKVKEPGRAPQSGVVQVERLPKASVRSLLAATYPEARVPQLEAADDVTHGHPYLVQLLIGAASTVDLGTAIAAISTSGSTAFIADLLSMLGPEEKSLIRSLAWLGFPFSAACAQGLGGTPAVLSSLASRSLIVRAGGSTYRVHDIVGTLVRQTTTDEEQRGIRERIALFLRTVPDPTWFETRALIGHARAASLHEVARDAGASLLNFAMRQGLWTLVHEAAYGLTEDPESTRAWYPHFILGKCRRMTMDLKTALEQYTIAGELATDGHVREVCEYEKASVLCDLGRRPEADPIYESLCKSDNAGTRIEAKIGLALGMPDVDAAMTLLSQALDEARAAHLEREEGETEQAMGFLLAGGEHWSEAREHLLRAHEMRMSRADEHARDAYGWYHLLATALRVERALGNDEDAANAAHSLYRFALVSGSLAWEANSAHALCLSEPDAENEEIIAAVARLRRLGTDPSKPAEYRVTALVGLVLCQWTRHHYEDAIEGMLELQAVREEYKIGGPIFFHTLSESAEEENVQASENGAVYALLVPPGEQPEFLYQLVDRVVARRPEFARYVAIVEAVRPPTAPPGNEPTD